MSIFDKLKWIEHDKVDKAYNIAIDKCSHELKTKLDEIKKIPNIVNEYSEMNKCDTISIELFNQLFDKILTILGDK